jgi:pimeloyl-ACP methyl ester carboxylesterase
VTSEARSVAVESDGLRIRALVWGRDADPTVVLVHGNGAHGHWWESLLPWLVPGWRAVAIDLRGHGESGWPARPAYAMSDFERDLAAVVAATVPGPFALVGHSMGGRVALWYAARRPGDVVALGMLDSRLDPLESADAARYRRRMGAREGRGYPSREAAIAAFRFVPAEPDAPPEAVARIADRAVVERAPGDWTFRFDRGVLDVAGDGAGDMTRLLSRIAVPAFVANGRDSWVLDAAQRTRIVDALPRGEGREFPGAHHFLVSHAPEVGAALRRFLDTATGR